MGGVRRIQHVRRSVTRARGRPRQVGPRRWAFFSDLLIASLLGVTDIGKPLS